MPMMTRVLAWGAVLLGTLAALFFGLVAFVAWSDLRYLRCADVPAWDDSTGCEDARVVLRIAAGALAAGLIAAGLGLRGIRRA